MPRLFWLYDEEFSVEGESIFEVDGENCCSNVMRENSCGNDWELTACRAGELLSAVIGSAVGCGKDIDLWCTI